MAEVIKIQYDTEEAVRKVQQLTDAIAANKARQVESRQDRQDTTKPDKTITRDKTRGEARHKTNTRQTQDSPKTGRRQVHDKKKTRQDKIRQDKIT